MQASNISSSAIPTGPSAPRAWRSGDRFALTGPTLELDPRNHAARRDVADIALAGRLFAPHYAAPQICHGTAPATMIRKAADDTAVAVSELLPGEAFAVVDRGDDWAWGYGLHDRYVGYVRVDRLGAPIDPTHVVTARSAPVFAAADIKAPVKTHLPMGARVAGAAQGNFFATDDGFVHARHLTPLDAPLTDPVAITEALLGTPYVWGGRSGWGIDCSGLVQLALGLCGIAAPRDSDQQREALGVPLDETAPAQRGDLVFFPGHVGFMADETRLIHANAHAMAVTVEPLLEVVARAASILARRRLA